MSLIKLDEVLYYKGLKSGIKKIEILKSKGEEIILGQGSYGIVYKGEMTLECHLNSMKFDRIIQIAIKRLFVHKKNKINHPRLIELIKRELSIYESVKSPYIVQYYGNNILKGEKMEDKEYIDIYLELCDGNFVDLIKLKNRDIIMEENEALNYFSCLIKALLLIKNSEIHRSSQTYYGSFHRDINLRNILFKRVNDKIIVKLTDFGLSQYKNAVDKSCRQGTECSMSPENKENKSYDLEKNDSWSLGICLFVLLFGLNHYLQNDTKFNPKNDHHKLIDINDKISENTKKLLKELLEYDQNERLQFSDLPDQKLKYPQLSIFFENIFISQSDVYSLFDKYETIFINTTNSLMELQQSFQKNDETETENIKNLIQLNSVTLNDISYFIYDFFRDQAYIQCLDYGGIFLIKQFEKNYSVCYKLLDQLLKIEIQDQFKFQNGSSIEKFWFKLIKNRINYKRYKFDDIYFFQMLVEEALEQYQFQEQINAIKPLQQLKVNLIQIQSLIYGRVSD